VSVSGWSRADYPTGLPDFDERIYLIQYFLSYKHYLRLGFKTLIMSGTSPVIKKNHLGISCSQEWENMPDHDAGKYCNACSKPVLDFTDWSRSEIIGYFKSYPKTCGMFKREDVDTSIIPVNYPSVRKPMFILGLVTFLGIHSEGFAQSTPVKTSLSGTDSGSKNNQPAPVSFSDSVEYIDENGCPVLKVEKKKIVKKNYRRKGFYLSRRFPFVHRKSRRLMGCFAF
jgi:hypothetical protein